MSLYHEAAEVLATAQKNGGSLKSITLGKKGWKSDAKTLFALTTEAAKWSDILSDVVERSGILALEKNLSPTLALLVVHDLLLSRKGIALPQNHGLAQAISRHKARLSAELTKARIRRGFASLDELRASINSNPNNIQTPPSNGHPPLRHPRWIRINTLRTSLEAELSSTFADYKRVDSLAEIMRIRDPGTQHFIYLDAHVPDLVAIPSTIDATKFPAYRQGRLILQEKASCFPAYLLCNIHLTPGKGAAATVHDKSDDVADEDGDVIDACAAPGNKTTHLAAILTALSSSSSTSAQTKKSRRITACEKDAHRAKTLATMVQRAGAEAIVSVRARQDFLRLDPHAAEWARVTAVLLDPSCSGSGIVGRDEVGLRVRIPLPSSAVDVAEKAGGGRGKKRKRGPGGGVKEIKEKEETVAVVEQEEGLEEEEEVERVDAETAKDEAKVQDRLVALSAFQLRTLEHAMAFPAATRIAYSTCSVHAAENEHVVVKALVSTIARQRGWRVLLRGDQVDGMRQWPRRGVEKAVQDAMRSAEAENAEVRKWNSAEIADACIRCEKGGEEGTMGFFVAGFVRDPNYVADGVEGGKHKASANGRQVAKEASSEDEWGGFSDAEI